MVNGKEIANTDGGWWVDIAFRKVDLGRTIRAGQNEIIMRGVFARDSELESVYVVGNFGVSARRLREEHRLTGQVFDRYAADFRLTALPVALPVARMVPAGGLSQRGLDLSGGGQQGLLIDLTQAGLPFFAGRATLSQTLELAAVPARAVLAIDGLRAALVHVRVNGKEMGVAAWQPHAVDVTRGLKAGRNVIEVELVGTLRNLLGPHHLNGGDLGWTGPGEFRDKSRWTDDYILVPFGFESVVLRMFEA